jgi:U3 small nucleolar RNA-associated protein 23
MKLKNAKHIRRWISFFKINYNFHVPYKVLLDGNFLKLCYDRKFEFKEKMTKFFKGTVWLQVTTCVLRELK